MTRKQQRYARSDKGKATEIKRRESKKRQRYLLVYNRTVRYSREVDRFTRREEARFGFNTQNTEDQ